MNVTIVNQFYTPDVSPTAHLASSLAEYLSSRGDHVNVIASASNYVINPSSKSSEEGSSGVTVCRVWTPKLGKANPLFRLLEYIAFYVGAFSRILFAPRQDLIISLTTPPFIAVAGVMHKLFHSNSVHILWNMDCYPEILERSGLILLNGSISKVLRRLNEFILQNSDRIVCLDSAMQDLLNENYGASTALPIVIIPNWEKASLFRRSSTANPSRPMKILYLGNAGYGHEFETVLDAAEKLRNDVEFIFYGGGKRYAWIREEIVRRKLRNVKLNGYRPKEETPALMEAAQCALITLRKDVLGIMSPSKLHSNLAMGLPIIYVGPEKSNVDDAIVRFDCGMSVRNGDTETLVHCLQQLISDTVLLGELRVNARRAFEEAYSDGRTLTQFSDLIKNLGPSG